MSWNIVGHGRAIDLLQRSIATGRVSHAYLLCGPARVGKLTLAIEFAKTLNCESATASAPCGSCRRCRLIDQGLHPEVRVVAVKPPHRVIRVVDVASIQSDAALLPADSRRKVYIVEQAELLHPDAAARLLKTLEEPPASVVLILTSIDAEAMLPTLVSRCQRIRLRPLSRSVLTTHLVESHAQSREAAELISALANGCVGWAVAAIDDPRILADRVRRLDDLERLVATGRADRLRRAREIADRWSSRPDEVRATLETWVAWWRDVLRTRRGLVDSVANLDRREALERHARQLDPSDAARASARAQRTLDALEQNANVRLTLDVALLDLPRLNAGEAGTT